MSVLHRLLAPSLRGNRHLFFTPFLKAVNPYCKHIRLHIPTTRECSAINLFDKLIFVRVIAYSATQLQAVYFGKRPDE